MFFLSCINQLLKPNADFFSITFNDNEALLILDDHAKREFLPKNGTANAPGSGDQNDTESTFEFDSNSGGVRVSRVQWTVLSLDVSRSPARLRKIADSMQSSSIPVLYQSAMNCDYLFVRHLFSSQGVMTDRRQVPKIHLQRTLSVLSEEVGLVLSGDERPTHQGYSLGRDWEKSRSRKPKRRVRHPQNYDDHVASQSFKSTISGDSKGTDFNASTTSQTAPTQDGIPRPEQRAAWRLAAQAGKNDWVARFAPRAQGAKAHDAGAVWICGQIPFNQILPTWLASDK